MKNVSELLIINKISKLARNLIQLISFFNINLYNKFNIFKEKIQIIFVAFYL